MTKDETHKKLLEAAEKGWLYVDRQANLPQFTICKHNPSIGTIHASLFFHPITVSEYKQMEAEIEKFPELVDLEIVEKTND